MKTKIITINWMADDEMIDQALEYLKYPPMVMDGLGHVKDDWKKAALDLPAFWEDWKAVRDDVGEEFYYVSDAFCEIEISNLFGMALEFQEFPKFPKTRAKFLELLHLTNHRIGAKSNGEICIIESK